MGSLNIGSLKEKVLSHYDRMIAFTVYNLSYPHSVYQFIVKMRHELGESADGFYCPLCRVYGADECEFCPVGTGDCRGTPYWQIRQAYSVREYLEALRAERDFLEELDYEI
jgi:hypothetical protein